MYMHSSAPLQQNPSSPPGITRCRLMKDNKQQVDLIDLLMNDMPKDAMENRTTMYNLVNLEEKP